MHDSLAKTVSGIGFAALALSRADALRAVFEESSVSEIFHGENQ